MIKMSKIFAAVAVFIVAIIAFSMLMTGCQIIAENEETLAVLEIVDREPMAVRHEPPRYNTNTKYEYQWDWWNGEYKLLPVIENEYIEEKFCIQYAVIYSDGSTAYVWETVPQTIYYEVLAELSPMNILEPTT